MMTPWDHLVEAPSSCGPEDVNFAAFIVASSIISGCDAVEEFLACGLWPLSEKFGFRVETMECPMFRVMVLMPPVTTIIEAKEFGAAFEVRVMNAANLLVGNYNVAEHNAYQGFRHG
jgi:hypothetical protein